MYAFNCIFPIPEIEDIICAYIDDIKDLVSIAKVNHYYYSRITKLGIYTELRNFSQKTTLPQVDIIGKACQYGSLYVVQYFAKRSIYDLNICLSIACLAGHIDIAKWLHTQNTKIDSKLYEFSTYCAKGHLNIISWLYDDINMYNKCDIAFREACSNDRLDVAIWLYNIDQHIDIHAVDYYDHVDSLYYALHGEQFDMTIWLCCLPEMNNLTQYFADLLMDARLKTAIWLFEMFSSLINLHNHLDDVFWAGIADLSGAIWIYNIDQTYDIHTNNDELFSFCCSMGWWYTAIWLYNLDGDIYISDDVIIKSDTNDDVLIVQWRDKYFFKKD